MNILRWLALSSVLAALLLLTIGCDDVVLSNPLPSVVDDRLVGSWARPDGMLAFLIKRGEGNAYQMLNSEELKGNGTPPTYFLVRTGGMLFAEGSVRCDGYAFKTPEPRETPNGCWTISRFVLADDTLEMYSID